MLNNNNKKKKQEEGGGRTAWWEGLGISQQVLSNCIVHHLYMYILLLAVFLFLFCPILSLSQPFYLPFFFFFHYSPPSHWKGRENEWMAAWCWADCQVKQHWSTQKGSCKTGPILNIFLFAVSPACRHSLYKYFSFVLCSLPRASARLNWIETNTNQDYTWQLGILEEIPSLCKNVQIGTGIPVATYFDLYIYF